MLQIRFFHFKFRTVYRGWVWLNQFDTLTLKAEIVPITNRVALKLPNGVLLHVEKERSRRLDLIQRAAHQLRNAKSDYEFSPSVKILSRIIKVMLEKNSVGKTNLSQQANVNYVRLSKHLKWLEKRNLVELVIEDSKICIILTESGRKFALTLTDVS